MSTWTDTPNGQSWVAECKFEDREMFRLGTVYCEKNAQTHEIEKEFHDLFASLMPENTPMPKIVNMIPGCLVFIKDNSR